MCLAIPGKIVEMVDVPAVKHFTCPDCKAQCVMYPRSKPMGVQHSIPTCKTWQQVEGRKDDLERFLIKAGVHLLVPQGDA